MPATAAVPYDWNAAFPMLGQSMGGAMPMNTPDIGSFLQAQQGGNPFAGASWGSAPDGNTGIVPPTQTGGIGSWLGNYQNLGTVVQGFGSLAQAWLSYQGLKQAREALGLQKEAFNANLNNSMQTYNTSLEDRIRGRTADYSGKEADVQTYLAKHSLTR